MTRGERYQVREALQRHRRAILNVGGDRLGQEIGKQSSARTIKKLIVLASNIEEHSFLVTLQDYIEAIDMHSAGVTR